MAPAFIGDDAVDGDFDFFNARLGPFTAARAKTIEFH
jgi:hypothetical protein